LKVAVLVAARIPRTEIARRLDVEPKAGNGELAREQRREPAPDLIGFEQHFAYATQHGIDQEHRDLYAALWERGPDLRDAPDALVATGCDLQRRWWRPVAASRAGAPAEPARATAPRPAVCSAAIPGLNEEGKRLYGDIAAYAAKHGLHFYSAFTGVTGRLDIEPAHLEQPPLQQTDSSDQTGRAAF
jgi:hypothetical protein